MQVGPKRMLLLTGHSGERTRRSRTGRGRCSQAGGQSPLIASRFARISHAPQLHHERNRRRFVSEVGIGKEGRRERWAAAAESGLVGPSSIATAAALVDKRTRGLRSTIAVDGEREEWTMWRRRRSLSGGSGADAAVTSPAAEA